MGPRGKDKPGSLGTKRHRRQGRRPTGLFNVYVYWGSWPTFSVFGVHLGHQESSSGQVCTRQVNKYLPSCINSPDFLLEPRCLPGLLGRCIQLSDRPSSSLPAPFQKAQLTVTVISCLEGGGGLQIATQGPIPSVAVVEAAIGIHGVLGVGRGGQ